MRCDESTLSTQHTSTRTSREGAEARGYLAGGEDAFKAALHAGEIREVKSKTGKALYQWSEEVCEDHHDIQLGAHLSSSREDAAAARSEFTDALDAMSFETGLNIVLSCLCKSFDQPFHSFECCGLWRLHCKLAGSVCARSGLGRSLAFASSARRRPCRTPGFDHGPSLTPRTKRAVAVSSRWAAS